MEPLSLRARHYRTGQPVLVAVATAGGHYQALDPLPETDAALPWIAPGLVDLQVNGFAGVDFNREGLGAEAWRHACGRLAAHGCTRFLATLITHSDAATARLLAGLRAAREAFPDACAGFHLEGPFLNPDPGTRGAHDPARMTAPDAARLDRWNAEAGGAIRLLTLAPEVAPEAAGTLLRHLAEAGIRGAIGHSAATGETLRAAVDAGAGAWIHLGNAVPRQVDKFENVFFHVLAEERLAAFLIPDGLHVPAPAFRALARALGSRLLLTTDAMAGADAAPGPSTLGAAAVEVGADGRATLPGSGRLAGSTLTPFAGVFRAAALAGLPWAEMWDAFSTRPAAWIARAGEPAHGLAAGNPADFCLFDAPNAGDAGGEPRLRAAYRNGVPIWQAAS